MVRQQPFLFALSLPFCLLSPFVASPWPLTPSPRPLLALSSASLALSLASPALALALFFLRLSRLFMALLFSHRGSRFTGSLFGHSLPLCCPFKLSSLHSLSILYRAYPPHHLPIFLLLLSSVFAIFPIFQSAGFCGYFQNSWQNIPFRFLCLCEIYAKSLSLFMSVFSKLPNGEACIGGV